MKNAVFCDAMKFDFARTEVSEERIAYIIKAERISDLGKTLAVISN
jgi:hypothetical protein